MKLLTFTLALLSATSVLTSSTSSPEATSTQMSEFTLSETDLKYKDSVIKCQESLQYYFDDCIPESFSNTADFCSKVSKNDKCKDYFENGTSKLEGCNQLPNDYIVYYDDQKDLLKAMKDTACEKDENGKNCPITDLFIKLEAENNEKPESVILSLIKEEDKFINETCQSKTCTDITVSLLDSYLKTNNEASNFSLIQMVGKETIELAFKEFRSILDKLKNNECLVAHVNSGAYLMDIKFGTTLLISIGLLFYFF